MLDDEPVLREVYPEFIRTFLPDAEILLFNNGDDAFEELLRRPPDLFTMDICHTGMGCIEICQWLAERKAGFPVLIISGFASADLRSRIQRMVGGRLKLQFLSKPFSSDVLSRLFKKHLRL